MLVSVGWYIEFSKLISISNGFVLSRFFPLERKIVNLLFRPHLSPQSIQSLPKKQELYMSTYCSSPPSSQLPLFLRLTL